MIERARLIWAPYSDHGWQTTIVFGDLSYPRFTATEVTRVLQILTYYPILPYSTQTLLHSGRKPRCQLLAHWCGPGDLILGDANGSTSAE